MGVKIVLKPRGAYSRAYPSLHSIKHLGEWLLFLDKIHSIAGYPIFSSPNILVAFLDSLLGPNYITGSNLSVFPKMQCSDHQQNSLACTFCFFTGASRKFSLDFCTLCLCMLIDSTNFDINTSLKYQHITYIGKKNVLRNFKDQKRPRIVPRIHNRN